MRYFLLFCLLKEVLLVVVLLAMTDDVDKISSKNGVVSVKREQMDGDTFTFYNEENVCTRCQSSVNLEGEGRK